MPRRADTPSDDPAMGSVEPGHHPTIAFPDDDWTWFAARIAALELPVDAAALRAPLERLHGHLVGVNRWLNLTRIAGPREYLHRHALDALSATLDPRLRRLAAGAPCLDLGSGGGYPGLPLALACPGAPWVLADARRKKAEFLAAAATLAGAHVSARHLVGAETPRSAPDLHRRCQLVTSRAMAAGAEVLAEAATLLRPHGHCIIFKGPSWHGAERDAAHAAAPALGYRAVSERTVVLDAGDEERVLAVFERLA